jgi:hypothetical protein
MFEPLPSNSACASSGTWRRIDLPVAARSIRVSAVGAASFMLAGAVFFVVAAAVFFVLVAVFFVPAGADLFVLAVAVFFVPAGADLFVLAVAVFFVPAGADLFTLAVAVFFAFIPMPSSCPALFTSSTARANFWHEGTREGPLTWNAEASHGGRASPAWGEVAAAPRSEPGLLPAAHINCRAIGVLSRTRFGCRVDGRSSTFPGLLGIVENILRPSALQ